MEVAFSASARVSDHHSLSKTVDQHPGNNHPTTPFPISHLRTRHRLDFHDINIGPSSCNIKLLVKVLKCMFIFICVSFFVYTHTHRERDHHWFFLFSLLSTLFSFSPLFPFLPVFLSDSPLISSSSVSSSLFSCS